MEVFIYEGSSITFDFGKDNKMVNATQMAKSFGKRPVNFLDLDSTKKYIEILKVKFPDLKNIVLIKKGKYGGTWFCEKLALKYSSWLSAEFELWVYEKIEELLTKGTTSLQHSNMSTGLQALQAMVNQMAIQEQRTIAIEQEQQEQQTRIRQIESKVTLRPEYYTIAGWANKTGQSVGLKLAATLGRKAASICKKDGHDIDQVNDPRFGSVGSYPVIVLKEVFSYYSLHPKITV